MNAGWHLHPRATEDERDYRAHRPEMQALFWVFVLVFGHMAICVHDFVQVLDPDGRFCAPKMETFP